MVLIIKGEKKSSNKENWDSAAYWAIKEREPGEGLWSTNYFIEMKIYRYRGILEINVAFWFLLII